MVVRIVQRWGNGGKAQVVIRVHKAWIKHVILVGSGARWFVSVVR